GRAALQTDLPELSERIEVQLRRLLDDTAGLRGDDTVAWLGGLRLPRSAVLAHTLSELVLHGFDIARAEGREFDVPADAARLYFEVFMVEVVRNAYEAGFLHARVGADAGTDVVWELRI